MASLSMSSGVWLKSCSSMSFSPSSDALSLSMDSLPAELRGNPIVLQNAVPLDPFVMQERQEYTFYGLEQDGALRPGGQVALMTRRTVGLLLNYVGIGALYGGINSLVVPFFSNYLQLQQYQPAVPRNVGDAKSWGYRRSVEIFVVYDTGLIQSRAMWQLLMFELIASFCLTIDSNAVPAIEANWVDVDTWPKSISLAAWSLAFIGVDVVTVACTVFDVVRRRSFWMYMQVLAAPAVALRFIVQLFPIVELAPRGIEGTTYGLVITFRNMAIPLGTTAYKAINSHFSVSDEDVHRDSDSTRLQVTYTYLIAWALQLMSLAFIGLLPRQKLDVQQLRYYGGYSASGGWLVVVVLFSVLAYVTTANVLSLFESTACLRVAGDNTLDRLRSPLPMKSAVLFTLLAVAVAAAQDQVTHVIRPFESEEKDCPKYCLDIDDPVGDEEGNMYSNECYMKRAKCEKNKKTTAPPFWKDFKFINDGSTRQETPRKKCSSGCPDVELSVCGSDGVRYGNPCELKIAACKHPELNIVEAAGVACSKSEVMPHVE
ncbi:hypothetical protein JG687_00000421 [Phytophthora cactorum]|uniref:Kazal-like domain-containing protein n=2 Tax=Phytophthora cactorum TaxID=29920 RepID=A0A8T1V154_9STRA|nr:hypothetical protein JG687_00000421 [Phytophthora cactorum]